MPRVKLFARFREIAGVGEIEIEGKNLKEVVENLTQRYPKLREAFFEGEKLKDFVQIMVNGKNARGNLNLELSDRDLVAIFPPVSGG
ncbi:MAG: MoaD family protein [Archaeoglobaceae archaeon]|nr:MoaD family protein [Archaeoglobaceae archaeon]MDW8128643.1 ubiquitin-like small modifier protein 1 [Archaeoglobaceae archaeon]